MGIEITFLGGVGTVTGSKFLVEIKKRSKRSRKILIDAGLFQGDRKWREQNWQDPPNHLLPEIDACLITHAHVDHVGILPRYQRLGLRCPVFCTPPTSDILPLVLMDSAQLQEEDALYRQKLGRSRHKPPMPLYTSEDAERAIKLVRKVKFNKPVKLFDGITAEWRRVGHILGAASIRLCIGDRVLNFSGDVGRYGVPILRDPEPVQLGDLFLIESTYGASAHPHTDPPGELARVINAAYERKGVVLIPSFAIGRTQIILYYLRQLKEEGRIADLPIIIDSPMAREITKIYTKATGEYDEEAYEILRRGNDVFAPSGLRYIRDKRESIGLNSTGGPMVIISASGMLSGGRVLHHLYHRVSHPQNTILFVGYQPPGGKGHWLKSGPETVRIFGEEVPVRAQIEEISALSAHADCDELLRWCRDCTGAPGKVAVIHGEAERAGRFRESLVSQLGWDAFVAEQRQTCEI